MKWLAVVKELALLLAALRELAELYEKRNEEVPALLKSSLLRAEQAAQLSESAASFKEDPSGIMAGDDTRPLRYSPPDA